MPPAPSAPVPRTPEPHFGPYVPPEGGLLEATIVDLTYNYDEDTQEDQA